MQDWALIIEALVMWAGEPSGIGDQRKQRAYELVEAIAAEQGVPPNELAASIDPDWSGPRSETPTDL